jgi:hypothetical protein
MYLNDISSSPEDLSPLSTNGTSHGLQLEHKSIYIYIYIYEVSVVGYTSICRSFL